MRADAQRLEPGDRHRRREHPRRGEHREPRLEPLGKPLQAEPEQEQRQQVEAPAEAETPTESEEAPAETEAEAPAEAEAKGDEAKPSE